MMFKIESDFDIEKLEKRKSEIIKRSTGLNYSEFETDGIGFNYEKMMGSTGYTFEDVMNIQKENMIGTTPLTELKNLTEYARKFSDDGYGAKILLKDEAANLSGSFKARRAAMSVHKAKQLGYKGVIAATSGNYGAAVAAMAAKYGLQCIIIQECFDSKGKAQPEILEKARACEAYGAEVIQLSVGPELFYTFLHLLDVTKFFNASLYSPYGILGIETLGYEIANETKNEYGKFPELVIATNAGGGNLTGTARGLERAGAHNTEVYAASVNLRGLHMANDTHFNKKSFTTGHTGFGIPFAINPDRSDVPRSAARVLRYVDKYYVVNQGSVFFITEALAALEGMERGPAGNTSLAVAFRMAQKMRRDEIIVVQESEYSGAGKHHNAQLAFAKENGIELKFGDPLDEVPGSNIIFPKSGADLLLREIPLRHIQKTYLKRYLDTELKINDYIFLEQELRIDQDEIEILLKEVRDERKK
jgi:cysteine synthase